jgi:hypothetical protein
MDPLTFYAIERILAVAIGGLSIVLGYLLFLHIPVRHDSSGEFKLPWNLSIGLTRVGPGAFFALFGTAVVAYSLHGAMRVSDSSQSAGTGKPTVEATGAMPATARKDQALAARRLNLAIEIEFLNQLGDSLRSDLSAENKRAAADHANALKLAVMQSVWGADWGDEGQFREWAEGGATDPPPRGSEAAARYFRTGAKGTP